MEKVIHLGVQSSEDQSYGDPNKSISRQEFKIQRKALDEVANRLSLAELVITPEAITSTVMSSTAFGDAMSDKENKIEYSGVEPLDKFVGMLWMDTSEDPDLLKRWNGTIWEPMGYNKTQIEQTAEAISLTVSEQVVSPIDSRLTTAEGTLVVQAGQIASKVSTTDLNSTLTNYSTITQTADKIALEIGMSGGQNFVRNGNFANGKTYYLDLYYSGTGNSYIRNDYWTNYQNALEINDPLAGNTSIVQTLIDGLLVGKTYTVGALVAGHRATNYLQLVNSAGTTSIALSETAVDKLGGPNLSDWKLLKITFVASEATLQLRLISESISNVGLMWIKDVRCNEGTILLPYQTHASEMIGAKYVFDGQNATFTGGGLLIKNNVDATVFTADTNGDLDITGKITSNSGAIGGWTIGANYLQSADGKTGISATGKLSANGIYYALWLASTDGNPQNAVSGFRNSGHFFTNSASIGGWTVNGNSIYNGGVKLDSANERVYLNTSAYFYVHSAGATSIGVSGVLRTNAIYPNANATYELGSSALRWVDIWCSDASLNGSDARLKKDISAIDKGIDLILNLEPVQYRWKAKEKGRFHYGFVAQELKKTMDKLGIDAGVYADPSFKPSEEDKERYLALRYTELIAPMVQTIQHLNRRIDELEKACQSRGCVV